MVPLWEAFLKVSVFGDRERREREAKTQRKVCVFIIKRIRVVGVDWVLNFLQNASYQKSSENTGLIGVLFDI